MGHLPPWYRTVRAARYLGVAPWDLLDRPDSYEWEQAALIAEQGEALAQEIVNKRDAD